MKTVTGALLLLLSEQAYAHANLIGFPNHIKASELLIPVSLISLVLGLIFIVWGLWADRAACVLNRAEAKSAPSDSETT